MKEILLPFILNYPTIPIAIALVITLIYTIYLHFRIRQLTKGTGGASLEAVITTALENALTIQKENEEIKTHAISLDKRLSHAIRNTQTLRYKAFETGGSNQSFSVAFLNEHGNGVVITSLQARDRMSTFAKPLEKYESTFELTEEELAVIEEARKSHRK
jgi:hypothetical protein